MVDSAEFSSALARRNLTHRGFFSILCVFQGLHQPSSICTSGTWAAVSRGSKQLEGSSLPEQSKTEWKRGAAGWTPVPQSRVSLSDSEARSKVLPLGVRAEFLLVSPDSQLTFQRRCAR